MTPLMVPLMIPPITPRRRVATRWFLALSLCLWATVAAAETPAPAGPALDPWSLPAAERVVAIGDLHGDFDATRAVLRLAGLIGADDRWSGGEAVLVQTGDQLDRGDGERRIIDLLERLRDEAVAAGGRVVVLNGNHELMNVRGDLRYVTQGGFAEFKGFADASTPVDPRLAKVPPGLRGRLVAFLPGGPYARILARRPVIARVGDTLFVHGGVLPTHVEIGLERINREVAAWVAGQTPSPPPYMRGEDSPVWSRHYSTDPDAADCALLARVLEATGTRRMVVGHTVQKGGANAACGGRVWRIDVGLSAHYGGQPAALEIRGEAVSILSSKAPAAPKP